MDTIEKDIFDLKNKIQEIDIRLTRIENLLQDKPKSVSKRISLKEFLINVSMKSDIQKTLFICYYLEKYEGLKSFNVKDIDDAYRSAKERVPNNINYKVFINIQRGYMMEDKVKKNNMKAWSLTVSGEKIVEDHLVKIDKLN